MPPKKIPLVRKEHQRAFHPRQNIHVRTLEQVSERRGSRVSRFVLKHWGPKQPVDDYILRGNRETHAKLRSLKIPTVPKLEHYFENGRWVVKQKDFSWTKKSPVVEPSHIGFGTAAGRRLEQLAPEIGERPLLGVARDLALMHKNNMLLDPEHRLLSPWIFYRKPNGKWDRAVIDFESILCLPKPKDREAAGIIAEDARTNFEKLLDLAEIFGGKPLAEKCARTYRKINPD